MKDPVFRFGRCEVDSARRQVVLDGQPRPLEPRPFDALLYLLQNRHRVVSKDELLDAVWKQRHLSLSVISRAVSLIRKAIGDEGGDAPLVRTVHGVGLRFVGEVTVVGGVSLSGQATGVPHAERPSATEPRLRPKVLLLAVLPFENLTEDASLDWVEFGLSMLTVRALEQDSRISVVELPALKKALATVPATADVAQRADAVSRLLGVDLLVHVEARSDPAGFRLDYAYGAKLPARERRSLRGGDLITLGDQLAGALSLALSPIGDNRPIHIEPMDPLSGQAFARAMQAVAEQKWKRASHLLRVALDMEPASALIRREFFACLATIGDESAPALGQELLEDAMAAGDCERVAFVHHMLGRCHAGNRQQEPARCHLDKALCLSQEHGPWAWSAMAMQARFALAIFDGEIDQAHRLMDVMRQSWARSPNQCLRINWLNNLSQMSWREGHLARAMYSSWAAKQLSADCNLVGDHAAVTGGLAVECGESGIFQAGVEHGEQALSAGLSLAEPTIIGPVSCTLCWLYREIRQPEGSARVVASLDSPEFRVAAGLPGLWMARGHHAATEQRYDEAAGHWREAVARARQLGAVHAEHVAAPWLLVALVQAQCMDEAEGLLRELRPRPDIAGYPRMTAAVQHGEALARYASGDRDAALALLMDIADTAPQSHWRASACMDAAWLHLDAGRLAPARRLMRDLGPWLEEHPVGRMLAARRRQAEGAVAPGDELARAAALPTQWLPSRS